MKRPKANVPPSEQLLRKPDLRCEDESNARGINLAGQRLHGSHHNMARGKRGPLNHEVVSGSPRAVRARLQNQGSRSNACYFAVTRRCSFVEQRGAQRDNGQDSWEPSCIEPGAFTSVGSGAEGFEGSAPLHSVGSICSADNGILIGHASDFSQSCGALSRAGSSDGRLHLPPHRNQLNGPLHARGERPVREMAVQTNRESILRHYKENGGGRDSGSDSDKENAEQPSGLMSARSGMTGLTLCDNMSVLNMTGRSVFRELQYPHQQQPVYEKPESLTKVTSKVPASQLPGNAEVAELLSFAVNEEYKVLAEGWNVGCPESGHEQKVALALKKLAKRAEKACMEALAQRKVIPFGETSSADTKALDDECAELEAQIAATDRRVAIMRETLNGASHAVELDPHNIVKDLLDRLSRNPDSEAIVVAPRVIEFENMMNDSVQGLIQRLIAAGSSCQQLPNRQKEILDQRNATLCAAEPATSSVGINVLRRLE